MVSKSKTTAPVISSSVQSPTPAGGKGVSPCGAVIVLSVVFYNVWLEKWGSRKAGG